MNSSKGDAAMAFHYDDGSRYAAVGDINYIVESVIPGKSKRFMAKAWAPRYPI